MKFSELYLQSKQAVTKSLRSLWCSDIKNDSQAEYAKQICEILENIFASEKSMPLVQCMDPYESILQEQKEEANQLVCGLWKDEKHLPYRHQFASWKAFTEKTSSGKEKSIVVTTGTGSGKTECFMLPLVADLKRKHQGETTISHKIEAIFIYPLNALMEDQKERLSELLQGTGLTFAVYNSSLSETDEDENGERIVGLPGEITNRRDMRLTPPNILLTNPTMLEYMLLRQNDQKLFTDGSLKWIVLDETHTYTGAGATELSMLIKRVVDAFGVDTSKMHFATSSATIGSTNDDALLKEVNRLKLCTFIASLCGLDIDQVEYISGKRILPHSSNSSMARIRKKILDTDFVRLDKIVSQPNLSVYERLRILDGWCNTAKYGNEALKVKVHFFFRVPDNGLFVKLTHHDNGHFVVYDEIPLDNNDNVPYLELVRCAQCGEYMVVGRCNTADGTYNHPERTVEDLFTEEDDSYTEEHTAVFALTKAMEVDGKDNGDSFVSIKNNVALTEIHRPAGEWAVVRNIKGNCPYCHSSLHKKNNDQEDDNEEDDEILDKLHNFRVSSDYISRLISEPILNQLNEYGSDHPHNGQQFISFVDSRQAAAKSTLGQNLEEERLWVYSTIFHALCKQKAEQTEIFKKRQELLSKGVSIDDVDKFCPTVTGFTWMELLEILKKDKANAENLCLQFLNRSKESKEINDNGTIKKSSLDLYLCSLLFEKLNKHPRIASSPETMALFTSYYPKLDRIAELPNEVKAFNKTLSEENRISLKEWKILLQIFLDFTVRSNGSVEMKLDGDYRDIELNKCKRFRSEAQIRRSAKMPSLESKNGKYTNVIYLLAVLYGEGTGSEVIKKHKTELTSVIKALWRDLTETTGLLTDYNASKSSDIDYKPNFRLNVADIAFKLYDKCCMCDVKKSKDRGVIIRPLEVTFKGYSPYVIGGVPQKPLSEISDWSEASENFPYYHDSGLTATLDDIHRWASEHRNILTANIGGYNNKLWGIDGAFANRLDSIYSYPNIFIQAEHTAQIDKVVAKKSQDMFKNNDINILACSTTMEMGVDLGSLEFVLMSSVPPQPSNYKQRAGRSGRNDLTRSACATLCKSDSLGLRTFYDPLNQLVNRQIAVPTVDKNTRKVIQRHISSYLLRTFIFGYPVKSRHNNLELEVIDFFTRYEFALKPGPAGRMLPDYQNVNHKDDSNRRVNPWDGISLDGDLEKTYYHKFLNYLEGSVRRDDQSTLSLDMNNLNSLMSGITCITPQEAVAKTKEEIECCYKLLKERASLIADKAKSAEKDKASQHVKNKWNLEFIGLLAKNLIEFFATSRFTPNANMPVDIVPFMQHPEIQKYRKSNSDPTYQLAQALTMYAPGNTVVIGNRARIVRGIKYNEERPKPFIDLYRDSDSVYMGEEPANAINWDVNKQKVLKMIRPLAFLPDCNETESRLVQKNSFTTVSAMLVNSSKWETSDTPHMFALRTSLNDVASKIVYYNYGIGHGYCICKQCGKTTVEYTIARPNRVNTIPYDMNNSHKKGDDSQYHKNLSSQYPCCGQNDQSDKLLRNVILGAEIQTDFCEIRIRFSTNGNWEENNNATLRNLLITLGVVFSQKLIEYLDKERNSINFLITPNMHLCLYDTNSGGSGYSTEFAKPEVYNHVLRESLRMLEKCSSRDEILDRNSYRYLHSIDVEAARTWLKSEIDLTALLVPDGILSKYPESRAVSFHDIVTMSSQANDLCLYVNTDWQNWNYKSEDEEHSGEDWKSRIEPIVTSRIGKKYPHICFLGKLSAVSQTLLLKMSDWSKLYESKHNMPSGMYPVARTNGYLYFSTESMSLSLSKDWASGALYAVPEKEVNFEDIPYTPRNSGNLVKFYLDRSDANVMSSHLAELVVNKDLKAKRLIDEFSEYCHNTKGEMEVIYQDEYLRSVISMITAFQFIRYFLDKFEKNFSIRILEEEYKKKSKYEQKINFTTSIDDSEKRDDYIENICNDWVNLYYNDDIYCTSYDCTPLQENALPHWRMLSFRLGKKQLILYPNGGVFNGWEFDQGNSRKYYGTQTKVNESIPLRRKDVDIPIMYDIELLDL